MGNSDLPMTNPVPAHAVAAPATDANAAARDRFLALLADSLAPGGGFRQLVLSGYRGTEPGLLQWRVRRLALRGEDSLGVIHRHTTRDVTKNHPLGAGLALLREALRGAAFDHAHLLTAGEDVQLATSRKGRTTLRRGKLAAPSVPSASTPQTDAGADVAADDSTDLAHDRQKRRHLSLDLPFLVDLGVTDAQHRLVPAMARKWRQIDKFVEVLDHAFRSSPLAARPAAEPVRLMDFGCGKGYLTFAAEQHLRAGLGRATRVTGVELRDDLVQLCNRAAQRHGLAGLRFEQGDIGSVQPAALDIVVALHACDTATDLALHHAIRAGAGIVLCSPCCHKQLRPQMLCPRPLGPMLQFGIHMGQQAEMVTDSLRALLLEAEGYDTQVFEFVALEHTSKNKMILAVKRPDTATATAAAAERARRDEALAQVAEIERFYGVREQALERLLAAG